METALWNIGDRDSPEREKKENEPERERGTQDLRSDSSQEVRFAKLQGSAYLPVNKERQTTDKHGHRSEKDKRTFAQSIHNCEYRPENNQGGEEEYEDALKRTCHSCYLACCPAQASPLVLRVCKNTPHPFSIIGMPVPLLTLFLCQAKTPISSEECCRVFLENPSLRGIMPIPCKIENVSKDSEAWSCS
jgi:hypothetical protein